jgi:hypothetical protein
MATLAHAFRFLDRDSPPLLYLPFGIFSTEMHKTKKAAIARGLDQQRARKDYDPIVSTESCEHFLPDDRTKEIYGSFA